MDMSKECDGLPQTLLALFYLEEIRSLKMDFSSQIGKSDGSLVIGSVNAEDKLIHDQSPD